MRSDHEQAKQERPSMPTPHKAPCPWKSTRKLSISFLLPWSPLPPRSVLRQRKTPTNPSLTACESTKAALGAPATRQTVPQRHRCHRISEDLDVHVVLDNSSTHK